MARNRSSFVLWRTLAAISLLGSGWFATGVHAELPARYQLADLQALERAFVELAAEVQPSVVAVRTYQVRDAGDTDSRRVQMPFSQGAGFVIDAQGFIATNRHVIEDADLITVVLDGGRRHDATVQQIDRRSDLAVLKIDAQGLKPVRWGDLTGVRINQWSFAFGNPFGRANQDGTASVSLGVVSATGRAMTRRLVGESDTEYYGNLIETTADIHPGNSGGPLFNLDGEVIGVVTAIQTGAGAQEGCGFAIPIDKNTRRILATLKSGQVVRYGFLGVNVKESDRDREGVGLAVQMGAAGAEIDAIRLTDGPAAKAGLKAKDVVIEFDGLPVESSDHLVRLVGFTPVGTEVPITYLRAGVKRKTTVLVGDRAEMVSEAK